MGHAPPVRVVIESVRTATAFDHPGAHKTAPLRQRGGAACHIRLAERLGPRLTFGVWSADERGADAIAVDIDFTGFAGDCIIRGRFILDAQRLTDQLNDTPTINLEDVVLDGLDGQQVTVPTFTIDRTDLCAVVGRGPRGQRALRVATDRRRLHVQVGPYVVLGRYHGPLGATSLRTFAERDPMVPLTDATIAYVVGGVLEVVDAPTLIINRELAAWYRETEDEIEASLTYLAQTAVARGVEA